MERILILGCVDGSIRKSIRALSDMGKDKDEILLAILPWMKLQREIVEANYLTEKEIGIKLILSEEDYRSYLSLLKNQDVL